jgi:hypothetical protein
VEVLSNLLGWWRRPTRFSLPGLHGHRQPGRQRPHRVLQKLLLFNACDESALRLPGSLA